MELTWDQFQLSEFRVADFDCRRKTQNANRNSFSLFLRESLPKTRASTKTVIDLGHSRWDIENQGFNEMANRWHADHVYQHDPTALLVFGLLAMICLTVFAVFYARNLKPSARRDASMLHVSRLISAELYRVTPAGPPRTPM